MIVERAVAIPMRDGTVLRADVYRPEAGAPVPAIVSRTCYDRSFPLTPPAAIDPDRAVQEGFALVCQDVRGRFESEGEFYPFASEGSDGYDTIEWLAVRPWCSGAIGMAGRSYPAAAQWIAAGTRPPHLRAISPTVIGSDAYNGWVYQGGAFSLGFNLFWVSLMSKGKPRPALQQQFKHLPLGEAPLLAENPTARFYHDWLAHPTADGYWREFSPRRLHQSVAVPAFNVGGWYDVFLGGTLENFMRMRREADGEAARDGTRLVVGPWIHGSAYGGYPDHSFALFGSESKLDLDGLQLQFFGRWLRGDPAPADDPMVRIFVMGLNRWRCEADWPLARARPERWYLRAGGRLSRSAPGADEAPSDEYVYDPADAAPTIGGPTSLPAKFMRTNSGPLDQRPLEGRTDVLVYSSEPTKRAVEVTGPLSVVLHAATSAPDTDFVAKLCDVDPDGFSRIVAEGVLRARFRQGFERARPIARDTPYEYRIDLVATSNVFLAGHQIVVIVTSSSFPRFDRNANSGKHLGADREEDLSAARQTIFHDLSRPSHIVLPVVPG
ncbi:MAG: CocE/NonD family hydrolase [Solirubrobacterales bacterium]|nr:CocE/NonD family hydrolase [Solirubrobacterales bacterium]